MPSASRATSTTARGGNDASLPRHHASASSTLSESRKPTEAPEATVSSSSRASSRMSASDAGRASSSITSEPHADLRGVAPYFRLRHLDHELRHEQREANAGRVAIDVARIRERERARRRVHRAARVRPLPPDRRVRRERAEAFAEEELEAVRLELVDVDAADRRV